MHYPGHQKEDTEMAKRNNLANQAVKESAKRMFIMPLVLVLDFSQFNTEYLTADLEKTAKIWGFDEGADSGWRKNKKGVILLPEHLVEPVMKHLYKSTHYGRDSLTTYIELWLTSPGISKAIRKVIARCVVCQNNLKTDPHQKKEEQGWLGLGEVQGDGDNCLEQQ